MLDKRNFHVVIVKKEHGTGVIKEENPDKVFFYQGKQVNIQF
jgi:hypothetical protein